MAIGDQNQVARDRFLFKAPDGRFVLRNGRGEMIGQYTDESTAISAASGRFKPSAPDPDTGSFLLRESSMPMESYSGIPRTSVKETQVQPSALPTMSPMAAEDIQQGQMAAAMPAMSTPLGTGLDQAQTPLNPVAQQQQNLKIGLQGPQLRGDQWYRNEEFYSGQERPAQYQASGGDPIWVASGGRVPMGILAERQSQLQAKKAELNKFIQSRYDPFKGKADPRYEQKYQQYARAEIDKFVQDWANANTGGNINEAYKQIYNDPSARAAFAAKTADVEAIGVANKTAVPMALDLLKGVYENELQVSPETMQLARQLATGMMDFGNGISSAERADAARNFERSLSKDKWWTDYGLKAMKEAGDVLQQQGDVVYPGGRPFLREREQQSYDRFIQQAVQHGVANGIFGSPQEAMEFIQARTPRVDKTELSQLSLGSGGGVGEGAIFVGGGAEVGPEGLTAEAGRSQWMEQSADLKARADKLMEESKSLSGPAREKKINEATDLYRKITYSDPEMGHGDMVRFPLFGSRSGTPLKNSYRLNREDGTEVYVIPSDIGVKKDGSMFILGRNAEVAQTIDDNPELAKKNARIADLSRQITDPLFTGDQEQLIAKRNKLIDERARIVKRVTKQKENEVIPLNTDNMASIPGVNWDAVRQGAMQKFGGRFDQQSKGSSGAIKIDY